MTCAFTIIMIPAALSVMEMLNVMGEILYIKHLIHEWGQFNFITSGFHLDVDPFVFLVLALLGYSHL